MAAPMAYRNYPIGLRLFVWEVVGLIWRPLDVVYADRKSDVEAPPTEKTWTRVLREAKSEGECIPQG